MRKLFRIAWLAGSMLLLGGCGGWQSALDPQGPHADHLANLIWIFTALCSAIWLAVMLVLLVGLMRRKSGQTDPLDLDTRQEWRSVVVVGGAVIATLVTVIGLTALSFVSQRALFAKETPALTINVTGYQWWWDVRYESDRPDETFATANEIHIPVGQTVTVKLAANDVIHSFWVPNLTGKMDLIPGQDNEIQFKAVRPGVYRGQCAEFCGWQHAHMGFIVVALSAEEFAAWRRGQTAAASIPDDEARRKGAELFVTKACVMCHTVRGTSAGARAGPDLTHFGSRRSIGAATLQMSRGNIAAWIVDPQGIKPGVNMPNVPLAADEIDPLVSYLAGLK